MIKTKAQTTLEVVVLTCVVVAAFLAMFLYLKASVKGNWKTNTDSFSDKQFSGNYQDPNDLSVEK